MIDFFKKLFQKDNKVTTIVHVETAPLSEEQLRAVTKESLLVQPSQLIVGCGQSVGRQRDHNEDAIFWFNATFANIQNDVPFGVFIVADGMGGHQFGEVASTAAVRAMGEHIVKKLYFPLFSNNSEMPSESLQEIMENGVRMAQQAVMQKAPGGGTTITAALVLGEQVTIAHVGDSRLYYIYPDGRMEAMTADHSLVRRLLDLGQINEEEAKNHPNKNVLYRALGQAEPFRPDIQTSPLPRPGYILICSDGLWGTINEDEIFRIATSHETPAIACSELVNAANKAGGPDNISVILIKMI
ncbi:MAG: protein phosphatase [Chloroflexi bacterium HGW-Chloroflexi-10]|nr:MAG: protein phosphatase [Chloroflexi bacterium HGW-Chloroflexi-10]